MIDIKTDKIEYKNHMSSSISATTWNYDTNYLTIIFNSGSQYGYSNVETDTYLNLINDKSIGKAFHNLIRGKYETECLYASITKKDLINGKGNNKNKELSQQ